MTLIDLFNQHFDFARKVGEAFIGTTEPKATHRLVCTSWNGNPEHDAVKRRKYALSHPDGYALSVCAVPLRGPRNVVSHHKFKRAIPPALLPIYEKHGTLAGKRRVLCEMATVHRTPVKLQRQIRTLSSAKCDALYLQLLRANRAALRRKKR